MSGECNGFVLLAVLWFVLSLITKGSRRPQRGAEHKARYQPHPNPPPASGDATQQEGLRLEQVLRELQHSLETAPQSARPTRVPLPSGSKAQTPESLEVDPEVRSLEGDVQRELRRPVDLDDEAEEIEARRVQAAATRDAPRTEQARPSALQQILQQPADHTAGRSYSAQQLREAVIWREILGPPVSLR